MKLPQRTICDAQGTPRVISTGALISAGGLLATAALADQTSPHVRRLA
jgi:hypothetical protein